MNQLPVLFIASLALLLGEVPYSDPCEDAKAGADWATGFAKDAVFNAALKNITQAFQSDIKEHAVTFGKDANNNIFSSGIANGSATGATIPNITNAFADLHNHPSNMPPDAGDFYGLIDINRNNNGYDSRFVVTPTGTVYALLVIYPAEATAFNIKYPRQVPAFPGGPPGFPVAIVDEFREIKYRFNSNDEMAMAYILEKYQAGVSLLKQDSNGVFKKLRTVVSVEDGQLIFRADNCP